MAPSLGHGSGDDAAGPADEEAAAGEDAEAEAGASDVADSYKTAHYERVSVESEGKQSKLLGSLFEF